MKRKTTKLKNLEKSRYSIITNDLNRCVECFEKASDINEIFMGRNRLNSIKYGLCIPLCRRCHTKYHNDRNMQLKYMQVALEYFLIDHTIKDFQETFKYIKGLDIF